MRAAPLLCLYALSGSALAGEIILVSDGSQGSRVVQQLRTEPVNGLRTAAGYPKVMKSDEVPGLRPGKLVTVVGFCGDRKAAQRAVNALKGKLSVYVRTVEGEWPAACPTTDPPPPTSPTEAELLRRVEQDPENENALYDYAQYLQMAGRLDEAEVQLDKLLKLNPEHAYGNQLQGVIRLLRAEPD
ncbi:MAG TPA: tetratricopeptide repeat protein [Myxococcales bacterium]|nr:tetratricopeptide repeat protein [Myxococcales bacterium]